MRKLDRRGGGLAMACALALSACGGEEREAPRPAPAAAPAFSDYADLEAGRRYTTTAFQPAVAFRVPAGAWNSEIGDTARHFAIAAGDPPGGVVQAIVAVHRIDRVYDPRRGGRAPGDRVPFAGDFAAWLAEHPRLRTSAPRPVRLLGLSGRQVDVLATRAAPPATPDDCAKVGDRCVPLFYDGLDPILYSDSSRGRFTVLALPGGGQLVVEQFVEPADRFRAGLRILRPLVEALALV